ncbi:hypothetical protein ACNOYE_04670 [Nannocystaceae bacterium ST9]
MTIHAQRASTSLASHFYETREDRSRRALVEAVTRQPETTMEELAAFVVQHPGLRGMTLDELLERVRGRISHARDSESATLTRRLERIDGASDGFTKIPSGPSWPEVHVAGEAARRIRGHEATIAEIVMRVARRAAKLGLERVMIYPESISPGDVAIDFHVDARSSRDALWRYLSDIEPDLPFELWLALG